MTEPMPVLDSAPAHQDSEAGFGALKTAKGPLPLKALDVKAHILGLVTSVTVTQTFVNTHKEPLEAVYIFPLPPRAAVAGFSMHVGGRLVAGKLFERKQARERYEEAKRKGQRAALAEEDRPNVFTLSVGNLMPGDEAEICFELAGLLTLEGEEAEWRFPLVVAPRYIPGAPLGARPAGLGTSPDTDEVPDASRLNPPILLPGYPNPVRLGIQVDWDPAGLPLRDVRSSLHAVRESQVEGTIRIQLAQAERVDRDFVLRGRLGGAEIQTTAVLVPDEEGQAAGPGTGTLMVTVLPPAEDPAVRRGRDVVFLLDRSGSMGGWKMVAARRAISRMVDTLGPQDRFAVIAFNDDMASPGGKAGPLALASDRNRFMALEFLAGTEAGGGTEAAPAIQCALSLLEATGPERDAIVFLVTDGQVGNEGGLLRLVGKGAGVRRFQIIGVDEAVNDGLLKRLADTTRGWFLAAESEDRLDAVLLEAGRKFGAPVATDIRFHAQGLDWTEDSLASSGGRDLYPGTPLILLGRCTSCPDPILVSGSGMPELFAYSMPVEHRRQSALRKTWARWRIRDLEDQLARGSSSGAARRELVGTSLAHGVLCRFTAFLAVDDAEVVNPEGLLETIVQPVEMPSGWAGAVCCRVMPSILRDDSAPLICENRDSDVIDASVVPTGGGGLPQWARLAGSPPALPGSVRAKWRRSASAAKALLEFLEGLGPVAAHTTGDLVLPNGFFKLSRLLKDPTFDPFPGSARLRRYMLLVEPHHRAGFQGRQEVLQTLFGELMELLRTFLEWVDTLDQPGASSGGERAFWEP